MLIMLHFGVVHNVVCSQICHLRCGFDARPHVANHDPQNAESEPEMQPVSRLTPTERIPTLNNKQLQQSCCVELLPKRTWVRRASKTQRRG